MDFKEKLALKRPVIVDGAMGTMLFKKLPGYTGNLELLNVDRPDVLLEIHREYAGAGADIIETNTFGGSFLKLAESGLGDRCEEINKQAAGIARQAADETEALVGGSVGPSGVLVEPMGEVSPEEVYNSFARQVKALENGGAHVIVIETMTDLQEARLALLAAKDNTSLPVITSMTFENAGTTITGTDMLTGLATLAQTGADVVGANCSMGPEGLAEIYARFADDLKTLNIPLSVWANAGMPQMVEGTPVYKLSPEQFANLCLPFAELGVSIIGGCCGTTPSHIAALAAKLKDFPVTRATGGVHHRFITSRYTAIDIETHPRPVIIGERLNPTARKKFAAELKEEQFSFLREESRKQVEEGAHILDINVGVPEIDEIRAMQKSVAILSHGVRVPLMIDSDNARVTGDALMYYPGIPVVNSINGKDANFNAMLPVLKRFGSFVVALCLDETGIHVDGQKRIDIGQRLVDRLAENGIAPSRVLVDPLMLTESAEPGSAAETLRVIRHFHARGIKTSLGISNLSFGLPVRKHINNAYLKRAVEAGLDAAIFNPAALTSLTGYTDGEEMALAYLEGNDPGATRYIATFSGKPAETAVKKEDKDEKSILTRIYTMVVEGNNDEIAPAVQQALKEYQPENVMNDALIQALEHVGDLYSRGEYFLPQMIASANSMKSGFAVLQPLLKKDSVKKTGKVVICTVKGDIHDIGKNIVAMMLENHGFNVIDLGKDVDATIIIDAVKEHAPDILCLSSLLTTTMYEMKTISQILKDEKLEVSLLVGGAVVTREFAESIGASYAEDAVEGARIAKKLSL